MRRHLTALCVLAAMTITAAAQYTPTAANIEARREFEDARFGIFIHWGIYSMFAQGEWYLNRDLRESEYAKAAAAFYPARFDAREWTRAIRDSGARYVTFTSRHHDGFSMFATQTGTYNIVDATPFRRDVLAELAEACREDSLRLHIYYSILDWRRTDYPVGRTGRNTGRQLQPDYDSYFSFMKTQVRELLTRYPAVGGLWLDGYWDHDEDSIPFDWRMPEFYSYVHGLRPQCLIGNNHHLRPIEGEDFQMFERDLPGENTAGLSGQEVSRLPLEMCQTMNGMWGYKVADQDYKSVAELVRLIARAAAKGSNLLLNIGPQPDGQLPAAAVERLRGIGEWMRLNGESIYGTRAADIGDLPWGVATRKDDRLFLHVLDARAASVSLPWPSRRPRRVNGLTAATPLASSLDHRTRTLTISLPALRDTTDFVVEIR